MSILPPIGGSFSIDREAAADLARAMAPDLTLSVHYDTFDVLEADAETVIIDVARRGLPVVLDEP